MRKEEMSKAPLLMSSRGVAMHRPLADIAHVAEYLGDTERHIRKLVFDRSIPVTRVGGKLRFDLDAIDGWLADHSQAVVPSPSRSAPIWR
jgi:excisionase family DNA binding protein